MVGVMMQILVLYGPMWTCILFDLIAYSLIWRKQRLMVSQHLTSLSLLSFSHRDL
jgi:hypothetical protein